ncbi:polyketide synthase [Rosistilla oblonga]|uniref:polyketide synthase n=1 Tax=Rosistilla oblonga TaxID=2527990 RepID=UPI003A96B28B
MPEPNHSSSIHPQLQAVLGRLRSMVRKYIVADFVLTALVAIGAAFWGGLLLDYGPILLGGLEMPRSARILLLVALFVVLVVLAIRLLGERLSAKLPDESLALLLERQHPELGERLMTSVQLARAESNLDAHSRPLYEHVRREAAQMSDELDIRRVFQWQPLINKAIAAGVMLLAVIVFALATPSIASHAISRLLTLSDDPWPRKAKLEMVGVEVPIVTFTDPDSSAPPEIKLLTFEDRSLRLARGGSATLRVRAMAEDRVVPELCTVHYETASGQRGQANMRRVGGQRNGYQEFSLDGPPLDGLAEDVRFTVRGLDDRLSDFEVVVVDPPAVAQLEIQCRYPEYLRDPQNTSDAADLVVNYAPGLRIREGSDLKVIGNSSKPLSRVDVMLRSVDGDGEVQSAKVADDGMSFSLSLPDFSEDQTLLLLPVDRQQISAGAPFRFFLGVVNDQPPEVSLNLVGIGSAITPVAKLPFVGTVKDDYELSRTEIALAPASQQNTQPVLRDIQPQRDGSFEGQVDLRALVADDMMKSMAPGERLNMFAEATDRYSLADRHVTQSDLYGLDVVSPEELLGRLERRELGLRARLEQSIDEIRQLRDVLKTISGDDWQAVDSATSAAQDEGEETLRAEQLRVLRIQQSSLQANKTSEELTGIAAALGDIILEMENNRVDSVDRRQRITSQVQQPLENVVGGELKSLRDLIDQLSRVARDPDNGPELAVQSVDAAEEVLLRLTAILDSMLDLESYNEILDIVRDLIDRQNRLIDETKDEQKRRVLDLFKPQ